MELGKKRTVWKVRPSAKGEYKSSIAKKTAVRDKVKNPKAKKALSKPHPRSPRISDIRPF